MKQKDKVAVEARKAILSNRRGIRRKPKPVVAELEGVAQKFWNQLGLPGKKITLRRIGATPKQIDVLHGRDWSSLSLWVRKGIKSLRPFDQNEINLEERRTERVSPPR